MSRSKSRSRAVPSYGPVLSIAGVCLLAAAAAGADEPGGSPGSAPPSPPIAPASPALEGTAVNSPASLPGAAGSGAASDVTRYPLMRSEALRGLLADTLLAQAGPAAPPPVAAGEGVTVGTITIYGDEFSSPDPSTGLVTVTGNPRAVRGADEIRATRMLYNRDTGEFIAEGNVIIVQGGQVFRADRATYNMYVREGQGTHVTGKLEQYYLRADKIFLKPGPIYTGDQVTWTTCDRRHPHWDIHPRELTVIPGDRWVARHVGLDLLGVRLFTLPKLSRSLQPKPEDENRALYPTLGYSGRYGPYIYQDLPLRSKAPVWLRGELQINSFLPPSAGVLASTQGRLQFVGAAYYRELAPNQTSRNLQVSRLPEVGAIWSQDERPRPGRFLAEQVSGVRYPGALDVSTKWFWGTQASVGYFRQHRGDSDTILQQNRDGGRAVFAAQAVKPTVPLGPIKLNDLRLMVRQNLYDTGDAFSVLGTGIGKRFRFGRFRLGIFRFDQFTAGKTPFLFDDVELKQEWRPTLAYRTKGFSFGYAARIRGTNGDLYDQVFSISKLFHCLEPRIYYRVRSQQIGIELRIPGLSGFHRRRTDEPATREPVFDIPGVIPEGMSSDD